MPKFRKKPVVIEAFQLFPHNFAEVAKWCGASVRGDSSHIEIETLEGIMSAKPGDWIIKGVQGEFYPCKASIFEATYEPVEADSV